MFVGNRLWPPHRIGRIVHPFSSDEIQAQHAARTHTNTPEPPAHGPYMPEPSRFFSLI